MELTHLRYLIAVSEETTFIKAAEKLRLAQPALSRQIHNLETELGAPVFHRGRNGVTLTVEGAIALSAARKVVRQVDDAVARARLADAGRIGRCTIYASVWSLWTGFSGRLVAYLAETEPGIEISLEEAGVSGHWGGLDAGDVDIAISTKPTPQYTSLAFEPLLNDSANVAILGKGHPLAQRESIRLEELAGDLFLTYDPASVNLVDHDVYAEFDKVGFKPAQTREVSTSEALIAMVAGGFGWSLHRRSLLGKIPSVAMVPVEKFDLKYPVALVWRKNETREIVFTVKQRIRELAASEFPDAYVETSPTINPHKGAALKRSTAGQIELRDLRYFTAVYGERSIGRAAEKLGKSQPALSRQITHLERDVGVKLFYRKARGITPTAAAESLYADARDILSVIDGLPSELARGQRAVAGRCTVAAVPSLQVRELIASVIRDAAEEFPHLDIVPSNMPTPIQPAAIQSGNFDVGLCHPFSHLVAEYPDIECRLLLPDVMDGALIAANHPLAKKKSITFRDLETVPFLFFRREFHPAFHDFVMETFAAHDYFPIHGPQQEGLQTMWSLTAEGQGWSFAFGSQGVDAPPGLVAVPIDGFSIPWGVNILTRRDESRATTLAVIDLLMKASRRFT